MQNDLTQGNLLTNIFRFSIPFFLSYFLQTLYGMADLFIVGQYNGAEVISAVSIDGYGRWPGYGNNGYDWSLCRCKRRSEED